ncbi:MAG: hypothetical protein ABSG54_02385 [Terriglobia bacterium]|jgi:hypothetical protein
MRLKGSVLAAVALLLAVSAASLSGADLRAGAAKAVVTPNVSAAKVYMAGFGNNRVATGVHDDLYARCLALGAGETNIVLCSVDLIGLFYDDVLRIREKVQTQAPQVTHIIVASTHDHEGPDTMGLWGPTPFQSGIDETYLNSLEERIASTAVEATRSMQPAHLTIGRDDHPLLAQLQSDSRPPYVKDPFLFVMRLTSLEEKPIATLVNWSDHPETLGGKNMEITADYPHWLCQYVEEHGGGTAVYFDGSIGGLISSLGEDVALQDPENGRIAKDDTWRKAELLGSTLGAISTRAAAAGERVEIDAILVRKAVVFAPLANDHFRVAGAAGIFKGRKSLFTDGKPDAAVAEKDFPGYGRLKYRTGHDMQTEVNYLQLLNGGKVVAEVATVPGEIYPELVNGGITRYPGADFPDAPFEPTLRTHMKSKYQFVFGLGNDELGYIIPKAEWDDEPPWLQNKPERWYGEINSVGPEIAGTVTRALVRLIEQQ